MRLCPTRSQKVIRADEIKIFCLIEVKFFNLFGMVQESKKTKGAQIN